MLTPTECLPTPAPVSLTPPAAPRRRHPPHVRRPLLRRRLRQDARPHRAVSIAPATTGRKSARSSPSPSPTAPPARCAAASARPSKASTAIPTAPPPTPGRAISATWRRRPISTIHAFCAHCSASTPSRPASIRVSTCSKRSRPSISKREALNSCLQRLLTAQTEAGRGLASAGAAVRLAARRRGRAHLLLRARLGRAGGNGSTNRPRRVAGAMARPRTPIAAAAPCVAHLLDAPAARRPLPGIACARHRRCPD